MEIYIYLDLFVKKASELCTFHYYKSFWWVFNGIVYGVIFFPKYSKLQITTLVPWSILLICLPFPIDWKICEGTKHVYVIFCFIPNSLYGARHTVRFQTYLLMERKERKRKRDMGRRVGRKEGRKERGQRLVLLHLIAFMQHICLNFYSSWLECRPNSIKILCHVHFSACIVCFNKE